jgi:HAD superfamily hydrolase (TIGR01509 family)
MKTILVDAWNTFVTEDGVFDEMQELLDSFPHAKIILTNANDEEMMKFGIVDMPYEVFTLKHEPNKTDPSYYTTMLEHFGLSPEDVVYFEHNEEAVKSAQSVGMTAYHYDKEEKDLDGLKDFLVKQLA